MSRRNRKNKPEESPAEQLENEFARWDYLYQHGGSDPFYPDGVNLNLVRNYIIYAKRHVAEAASDCELPEIYYRDTPPEVDTNLNRSKA